MSRSITVIALYLAFVCLTVTSSYCQPATAPDSRLEILETFITTLAERGQFNGNILIAEEGEIIYERAIGMRSPTAGDSLNLGSQFRLASACMPFSAMAVMTLEEAGRLSFEDLVEKHIPEWPYKGATIRNLLNEISGFPEAKQLLDKHWKPDLEEDDPDRIVDGNEQVIQMYLKHRPERFAAPGEVYSHGFIGYLLLATIVERVSGLPFHQYMREKVFLPAGMTDTYVYSPLREDPLTNRAIGIMTSMDGSKLVSRDFDYLQALDGFGIYSTIGDIYKWDRILYTEKLISQANLNQAFAPGLLNNGEKTKSGFGWGLYYGMISADGYRAGFGVWINRDIEKQNTIIILCNGNTDLWGGAIQGVRKILKGEDYEWPKLDGSALVGQVLLNEGEEAALALYSDLKNRPEEYDMGGPMGLQALGHFLSLAGHQLEALFAFRLNTEQYPKIAFLWDKLADHYHKLGDTANAVTSYDKALSIDTTLTHAVEMLQKLDNQ